MQPVRKVLSATHFKRVPSKTDPDILQWTPCSPGDPDAEERDWKDIEGDELQEPPLRFADFVKSLESVRPTVRDEDIKRHDDWTRESGASALHHVSRPPAPCMDPVFVTLIPSFFFFFFFAELILFLYTGNDGA